MPADIENTLGDYHLSTLILAKKLEALPRQIRRNIQEQIEAATEQQEQLQRALQNHPNVTPIRPGSPPGKS